jgi:agmatine deiminase
MNGAQYRMPAEWAPHAATWVSWPRNRDTWRAHLPAAQREFAALVRAIAEDEPVRVLVGRPDELAEAQQALHDVPRVECIAIPTNDAWARDYAPTFVVGAETPGAAPELAAVDWHYNAWGGKYPPFDDDQRVARLVAEHLRCRHVPIDLCLEGGALEIDADGVVLCTRTCAFDPRRNPGRTEADIEATIARAIGAARVLWLTGDALIGDDTDGHIDQLARFAPDGTILYAWTEDRRDAQFPGLTQNRDDLERELDRHGLVYRLTPLPLPDPVYVDDVQIPACYCNFYVTNRSVIVPQFDRPQDAHALEIVGRHFPDRRIVPLPSTALTVGLGSFHCLTQQQPAVPPA